MARSAKHDEMQAKPKHMRREGQSVPRYQKRVAADETSLFVALADSSRSWREEHAIPPRADVTASFSPNFATRQLDLDMVNLQLAQDVQEEAEVPPHASDAAREAEVGKSALLMSVLVIISRLTGFFRTWGQAYALGVTVIASCYSVANNLPNMLYEIVIGGMLVTAFLPVYLSVKKNLGREAANDYASNLITIVLILMGALTVIGFIFAGQIVWTQSFSASADFDSELAIYFFRFFVIEVLLYSLSSVFSGVLNAERDYFWSSAAPIFNNFVTTASFILYAVLVNSHPELALIVLALGNPLGVLAQVVLQMPSLKKHGIKLRLYLDIHDPAIKETLTIGVPSLVVMLCSFVTTSVMTSSSLNVTAEGASISYYARLWFTLPYAILAVPITTAMFTELSDLFAKEDIDAFRRAIASGLNKITFFMIPFSLYLIVFAKPLIVILAAGKFDAQAIDMTADYLAYLSISLVFYAIVMYLQKVCSAIRHMGIFALASVIAAAIQALVCLIFTPHFGINLVALSSSIYMAAVSLVAAILLHKQIGGLGLATSAISCLRTLAVGVLGAALGFALIHLLGEANSVKAALLQVVVAGPLSLVATYGIATLLRFPETSALAALVGRIRRR